ncbi:BolA family protein [Teredinibacter turnerae]|uniref:Stress-induced morphogen n=1 Tax=Teredinibacter turnerae (strain ATCC 39867 / T7901) TaxID=377629 RepID=C5BMM8_TERTT|nr:BolA/IbaG family iron-sulfur metabolism protein [Teredinibacter turnerae]ACR10875.1 stress-induced morphogen [Teredinibacter turnerae T7901]
MDFEQNIRAKLIESFSPVFVDVVNESHGHSVPKGSQTHFKATLVSPAFDGVSRVKRHQLVYGTLANELSSGVHALALHLYTEAEWAARAGLAPDSPACAGRK